MPGIPQLQGTAPTGDLYSNALAALYSQEWRILEPSFAQEQEQNVWELLLRDSTISQARLQRQAIVAPKSWQVEPATKDERDVRLAEICHEMIEGVEGFTQSRALLADAELRGAAYEFIVGRRRLHRFESDNTAREWWLPKRLQHVDKYRIQYAIEDQRAYPELFSVKRRQWERVNLRHQFLAVKFGDEESRLGYGRGLIESLYFLWWAGSRVMKDLLQASERNAQGLRIGKVDTQTRGASATDADTQIQDMLDVLEKHKGRQELAIDSRDDVVVHDAPTGGMSFLLGLYEKIDSLKIAVCMGSVRPFGANVDTGSFAQSRTEEVTADERTEFSRCVLDDAVTADLMTQRAAIAEKTAWMLRANL